MNDKQFLRLLDEILEAEPGTVKGTEKLEELAWDSLMVLGFIALMDERYGAAIPPKELSKCKTVADLKALVDRQAVDD
jgi:acyl carrier protein